MRTTTPSSAPISPTSPPLRLVSVGTKLAGSTILLVLAVTAGVYWALSWTQRENLIAAKETSASAVTRLFADSCGPGLVFGDEGAIVEELTTLGRNSEVEAAAVWSTNRAGKIVKQIGELRRKGTLTPAAERIDSTRSVRESDRVVVSSPISDRDGAPVGLAVVALSLSRENAEIAKLERTALIVSTAVAAGMFLLLMVMARLVVVGPLGNLVAAAKELEAGGRGEVDVRSADEVGQLARAFQSMAAAIRVREERLETRNRDMRLVLDNVGQGFVTLDGRGQMSEERSRVVDEWFGPPGSARTFWEYLGRIERNAGEWFELGWEAIHENVFPLSLCLDQLPKLVRQGEQTFELEYHPLLGESRCAGMIVVISDVTARVARQRAEQAQREMLAVFRRLLSDRSVLDDFFRETDQLVGQIVGFSGRDRAALKRLIHTVKGNAALFGIESVAACCHTLEEKLADDSSEEELPSTAEILGLASLWKRVLSIRDQLTEAQSDSRIELDDDEYRRFLSELRSGAPHEALMATAASWRMEPAAKRLAVIGEQIRALAVRLGRAPTEVMVAPTTLRVPPAKWAPFWSAFAHVIRNTVDHAIQPAAARQAAGKPPVARVILSLVRQSGRVVMSIEDDGPGVDWEALARRARERGVPHSTPAELRDAIFVDGISSRSAATATSGRGVGLGALREAVRLLGGEIEVDSEAGRGTIFRFLLPESMLADEPAPLAPAAIAGAEGTDLDPTSGLLRPAITHRAAAAWSPPFPTT